MLLLILTAVQACIPSPVQACIPSPNQWSCYTSVQGDTITALATQFHVNPHKLCDYNLRLLNNNCNVVPKGTSLIIPSDGCTPVEGSYTCHEVQAGESFASIAVNHSLVTMEYLISQNSDLMWNDFGDYLFIGMQIRIPVYSCVPDSDHFCYIATGKETLYEIADMFVIAADLLFRTNLAVIEPDYVIRPGIQLIIPKFCQDSPGEYFCYKLRNGDTLYQLGQEFNMQWEYLCEFNQIQNCSFIFSGNNALKIPIKGGSIQ